MKVHALTVAVLSCAATLFGDDRSVTFDKNVDFATLRTFLVHDLRISSARPEIKNALLATQVVDAIRAALATRGLRETTDRPDLFVDPSVLTLPAGRGASPWGRLGRGPAPAPLTDGTLVIDLTTPTGSLVWHGVYRRPADKATTLAQKLPEDAKKLISNYPPKKK